MKDVMVIHVQNYSQMDSEQQNGFFLVEDPFKDDAGVDEYLSLDDFKKIIMTLILGQRDKGVFMKGTPVCITTKTFRGTYDFSVQGHVRSRHTADNLDEILFMISEEYGYPREKEKESDAGNTES